MPDTGNPPTGDRLQDQRRIRRAALGLQWSWNHNPRRRAWSLSRRPGWLRLAALPSDHLVTARNTLTQILQGPRTTITTRIDVRGMAEGQRAGLAMFGVRPSWIGVVRSGGRNRVTLASEGAETAGPELTRRTIELRVEVGPEQTALYAYSLDDGRTFQPLGRSDPARALLLVEGLAAVAVQLRPAGGGGAGAAGLGRRRLVPGGTRRRVTAQERRRQTRPLAFRLLPL